MTLCHTEAQLLKRNEKLEELWAIDEQLREWHATSAWSSGAVEPSDVTSMTAHRQTLVADLKQMKLCPMGIPSHEGQLLAGCATPESRLAN